MQAAERLRSLRCWFHERPFLSDTLFAAAMAVMYQGFYLASVQITPDIGFSWADAGMLLVPFTSICLRRKWFWGAVGLSLTILIVAVTVEPLRTLGADSGIGFFVLTYTAAVYRTLPRALIASAVIWLPVAGVVYFLGLGEGDHLTGTVLVLINLVLAATVFWIGWVMRNRREKVEELSDRARIAEQSQEALAAQAVADEQRRIARELHDVVAHHISVIGVMSEGAKRVLRTDPDTAEEALTTVNQTARTALREMRDILTVLRQGQEDPGNADLEPQPTVDSLRALVAQTKEAGLPVRYNVRGAEYPLPTGVSLAVYRIVQEALTNTIKHAGPKAKAGVVVDYGELQFSVSIGDSGRGAPVMTGFSGGHGLIGMRERATLYGGTLQAGPQSGGGYLVEARFPKNAHLQGVKR
ncbi:sensor histidine kinase [Glycomyces sp. L485]|uniref:sensor histidine kinase n=1 Tax=Glycomyces sp. L485 TaxID=2909235 RepID=UPI001F4BC693|nr:sensor histidine kinase [Glycomyces sp. L485]